MHDKIRDAYVHPQFIADVMKPMKIEEIMDQEVQNLSGGELQRVALVLCLGKPADVYLIDEPSAYLIQSSVWWPPRLSNGMFYIDFKSAHKY